MIADSLLSEPRAASSIEEIDGWYVAESKVQDHKPAFALLDANFAPESGFKYCLNRSNELVLRVELPADDLSTDDESLQPDALTIADAASIFAGGFQHQEVNVLALCQATGWPCSERSAGRVAVELEVKSGSATAIVENIDSGLNVSVNLLDIPSDQVLEPQCFDAIAEFLLRIAGAVPMVRPVTQTHADRTVVQLCVLIPPAFATQLLSHAFSALSVAIQMSRNECKALCDPNIATTYLMMTT